MDDPSLLPALRSAPLPSSDPIRPASGIRLVIARLVRSADFERVLRTRTRANSTHFAVHHLADRPSLPAKPPRPSVSPELSTDDAHVLNKPVDDSSADSFSGTANGLDSASAQPRQPSAIWLGAVVPKRHARRAVTRTLLKRQIRAVVLGQAPSLAEGLWVVRLRAPFDRAQFVSAASQALQRVAREELEQLMRKAAQLSLAPAAR